MFSGRGKLVARLCQDVDAQDILADEHHMFSLAAQLNAEGYRPQDFPVRFMLFSSTITGAFHSMASF